MLTREHKKLNKEHCKNARLSVKIQCWYFRNREEIISILLSCITTIITHLIITFCLGMDI